MLLFLKKKTDQAETVESPPAAEHAPLHEFIPYYCHYNPHTLLTKNGELLQVIKIASNNLGLHYESGDATHTTVRDTVRRAISECVQSDRFSLWIHTLRKRKDISHGGQFKEPLAAHVNEEWQKTHRWKYQYYNEIYITILHEGQASDLFDKKNLRHVFLPRRNRKYHNTYLENAYAELNGLVSSMLGQIRQYYNAQLLSVVERTPKHAGPPVFYSEPMEFLGTLLNLRSEPFPLSECDLSQALATNALTFGFNALEAKNAAGQRRFGAMLTLKQYREMPPETADRVMQAPLELIVSQSFNFSSADQVLKQYKEQKMLFDISGDSQSIKSSGLDEMLRSNQNRPTDFGEQQTSIMVLVDDYKLVDAEVSRTQAAFAELGLITIREDIRLEECFWAQLPGNFEFIRRKDIINTKRVAGFSRLNRFPGGTDTGNHWGDAVALMPTMVGSPYFFNFHVQDNGHSVLFDFNSFHDAMGDVLLYFLLTSSLKYQGRIFVFDRGQSAKLFFDKIDATYHSLAGLTNRRRPHRLRLNPFGLEPEPRNLSFLLAWCLSLIDPATPVSDAQRELLRGTIEQIGAAPPEKRNLSGFVETLAVADSALAGMFTDFTAGGKFAGLFDTTRETFDLAQPVQAFNMDPAIHSNALTPLFAYLMHRIVMGLDGRPTLIVLHDACELLENAFFAPRLESLLEMLKQNNVAVICTTRKPAEHIHTRTFATLLKNCATHIYVPDDINMNYETQGVTLSAHDHKLMRRMERQRGDFLLRQGGESIALRVSLDEMDDVKAIYANDIKNLVAAGGQFASLPQDDE